jgi:Lon protease-like protein
VSPEPPTAAELAALPLFPLPNAVLFPGAELPLHIFEPRYRAMTERALAGSRLILLGRLRPGYEPHYHERPPVFEVAGLGRITQDVSHPDGRFDILLSGIGRVRIVEELPPAEPYRLVRGEFLSDAAGSSAIAIGAWEKKLAELFHGLRPHLPESVRDLDALAGSARSPGERVDRLAAALTADPDARQRMLEERDPAERYCLLVAQLSEFAAALSLENEAPLN